MKKDIKDKFFLPLTGFLSGLVNGLLGAGGGIIIVYALRHKLVNTNCDTRDIFANALCVMLPISALSCILYATSGNLSISGLGVYILPAILGGIAGGAMLGKIKTSFLKKLFGALVIYSGITLIMK